MGFLFTKIFWGCFLVVWGLSVVISEIIGKKIPIGRFFLAFLLIYCGIYLITRFNKPTKTKLKTNYKTEKNYVHSQETGEYIVVFGNNIIDISGLKADKPLEVNTVFGSTDLYLSPDKTYILTLNTVFGNVYVPTHPAVNFGTNEIVVGDEEAEEKIILSINTVFGKTNVIIKTVEEK